MLNGNPYPLVLLDFQMPGLDGFKVCELIKKNDLLSETKIILLTSLDQRGDGARCKEAQISGYLRKPIKQAELFKMIKDVLRQGPTDDTLRRSRLITRHTIREDGPKQRLKVLLAEDNLINQKFTVKLLGNLGYSALVAGNGREALRLLEDHSVDLVLMDVQMPVMDGFEATLIIREKEKSSGKHLPIMAMTAHALKGDREKCLEAGMDGYISKPVKPSELMDIIQQIISGKDVPKDKIKPVDQSSSKSFSPDLQIGPALQIDLNSVLESFSGDMGWFKEIFELFLEEYLADIQTIRGAILNNDSKGLQKAAHSFKSAVSLFKVSDMIELVIKLEQMGKEEKLQGAKQAIDQLELLIAKFIEDVENILCATN